MKKVIFFIVFFLFMSMNVAAKTVTLVKDRIDDTYVYYYDTVLERERYINASKYVFGNNIGYCLELGKSIESNIYEVTSSFDKFSISKDNLEYIKLIGYYGYDYPEHKTNNYYMAAQELIWNRLSSAKTKWVKELNPNIVVDVSKEREDILSLIGSHYLKPSFDGDKITLIKGEELVIEDYNNVLSRYTTSSDNVVIDNNKLIIKKDFDKKEIVLNKKSNLNKEFLLYTSGVSQKMLSVGDVDNVSSRITVDIVSGSLKISKFDRDNNSNVPSGDATLNGAKYELYDSDNNLIDTLIIGKKEKVTGLAVGKYYLKEVKASQGYLLDLNVYNLDITKDNLNIDLTVYEDVIKRRVDIFKVFGSDSTGILTGEALAVFEIYDKNNILVDTIITDNDGYASIVLPYGRYRLHQVKGSDNHYMIEDTFIDILFDDERPIYKVISNGTVKAKLRVVKKDAATGTVIKNKKFRFKIFDVNNNRYVSFKSTYPEYKVIDEFEINNDGYFVTPEVLSAGNYILYEIDDYMDGYLYNKDGIKFSIDKNSNLINDDDYGIVIEIPFYNKAVKGSIKVNKYGENIIYKDNSYYYDKVKLEDVYFEVYAKEDIYDNDVLVYNKDDLVGKIITNKDGFGSLNNLPLGAYYMIEVKSSNNNIVNDKEYDINLEYKDQYTADVVYEVDVENYLPKGKLVINKYETNSRVLLSNTLFEIYTLDDKLVYKGYTDKNGQIVLDDLLYGEYYISEVEATSGYRLLKDKIYFTIDKEELNIDVYNERIAVPNTGIINITNIIFIILMTFSIILLIFFVSNKRIKIITILLIIFCLGYISFQTFRYLNDNYQNNKNIELFIDEKINDKVALKYRYKYLLEIPSIGLKRGVLDVDNKYNSANYNIELLSINSDSVILASHNGNNYNSYFGKLNKLELGDNINYYYDGKIYTYIYSDSYEIKKNGYADIYRDENKKSIILITCKDNSSDGQVVYIGYLKEIKSYEGE